MSATSNKRRRLLHDFILEQPNDNKDLVNRRRVLSINANYQPITTISLKKAINKIISETAVVVLPPKDGIKVWQELTWANSGRRRFV